MLPCVRQAAAALAEGDFAYPPLLGLPAFRSCVTQLIFGDRSGAIASIAATGGTGAVALNLKLLKLLGITEVILPVPSWPNHRRLLTGLGFSVQEVSYLQEGRPTLRSLQEKLASMRSPCGVLLQGGGHNPTGVDFSPEQWKELSQLLGATQHVVLLDLAYQGLARGVEEDAGPARLFVESGAPLLVAWSASKNHSIYGLRTGLACVIADDPAMHQNLERHFMILAREMHSAAPVPGQSIVALVQERHGDAWRREIAEVRTHIDRKRRLLQEAFPSFAVALAGRGLYALLPLSSAQVDALKRQNIFLGQDGRVNIAGIPDARMDEFVTRARSITASLPR